jgi:hypothetical protein
MEHGFDWKNTRNLSSVATLPSGLNNSMGQLNLENSKALEKRELGEKKSNLLDKHS